MGGKEQKSTNGGKNISRNGRRKGCRNEGGNRSRNGERKGCRNEGTKIIRNIEWEEGFGKEKNSNELLYKQG